MKRFKEIYFSEGVGSYMVKHVATHKNPENMSDKEAYENDGNTGDYSEYSIHHQGKEVGRMTKGHYFGSIHGTLHGKPLPDLSEYGRKKSSGAQSSLHTFLKSKTGSKWAGNLHKYQK